MRLQHKLRYYDIRRSLALVTACPQEQALEPYDSLTDLTISSSLCPTNLAGPGQRKLLLHLAMEEPTYIST